MNRRLLLQVTAPALVIGLLLFGACLAGVWSVTHLQSNTSQILSQDVASLQAAWNLENRLRQLRFQSLLYAGSPTEERWASVEEAERAFEAALHHARAVAHADDERELLQRIELGYDLYQKELRDPSGSGKAVPVADLAAWAETHPIRHLLAPCEELMQASKDAMEQTADESGQVTRRTRTLLLLIGLLGPVSGLISGFGIARGLSRSIARISVRLQDVHARLDQEVSTIKLTTQGDIRELDERLDGLVHRVQEVVEHLQRQQEEMLRAEQLAAVGQLAASVAHEVRNPLTSIKLLTDLALRDYPRRTLKREDLQVIDREIGRLERKVQGLLDFARPPQSQRRPLDLREAVRQALRLVETRLSQQDIEVCLQLPDSPLRAEVDADQFSSVLVNLFLNALDAMPPPVDGLPHAAGRRRGRLTVTLSDRGASLAVLTVQDSGAGIPPAILERLFTPFLSSKPTGTGLGLTIARRVVELHGGRLTAANSPEGGACFTVILPCGCDGGKSGRDAG